MNKLENNDSFKSELQEIRAKYDLGFSHSVKKSLFDLLENNAMANLFMLEFNARLHEDNDFEIDNKNWWKMEFTTYPICFGKNYRYRVTMTAFFNGKTIIHISGIDYSRFQVGDGQPKFDFSLRISEKLRELDYQFYTHLFIKSK